MSSSFRCPLFFGVLRGPLPPLLFQRFWGLRLWAPEEDPFCRARCPLLATRVAGALADPNILIVSVMRETAVPKGVPHLGLKEKLGGSCPHSLPRLSPQP